ncbi:MAG: hypothetical protein WKG07_08755 [Hymenobacter sp.]
MLEGLDLRGPAWQSPSYFRGGGPDILAASVHNGLEGVVAKRLDSTYQPGYRSPYWLKIKNMRTQDVVVGGWKPGQGRRQDCRARSCSASQACQGCPGLQYVGKVGTGFTDRALARIAAELRELAQSGVPVRRGPA